jgi:fatty acid-binding protein DegV
MTKSTVVRILTDTTAVLPSEYIEAHGLEVIPQIIIFGQESYLEDYEISYSEFIRRLKASVDLPKTAAPPIGEAVKTARAAHGRSRNGDLHTSPPQS